MKRYCLLLGLSLIAPCGQAYEQSSDESGHVQLPNTTDASAYRSPPIIYLAPSYINQQPQTTIYLHPQSRYRKGATGEVLITPKNVPLHYNRLPHGYGNGGWQHQDRIEPSDGHDKNIRPEQPPQPPQGAGH